MLLLATAPGHCVSMMDESLRCVGRTPASHYSRLVAIVSRRHARQTKESLVKHSLAKLLYNTIPPPSTTMSVPLMYEPASLASSTMVPVSSDGDPILPIGFLSAHT